MVVMVDTIPAGVVVGAVLGGVVMKFLSLVGSTSAEAQGASVSSWGSEADQVAGLVGEHAGGIDRIDLAVPPASCQYPPQQE